MIRPASTSTVLCVLIRWSWAPMTSWIMISAPRCSPVCYPRALALIRFRSHLFFVNATVNWGVVRGQPVVMSANQQFSATKKLVFYAIPTIDSLESSGSSGHCTVDPDGSGSLIDCYRPGGDLLTIQSHSFSPRPATHFCSCPDTC